MVDVLRRALCRAPGPGHGRPRWGQVVLDCPQASLYIDDAIGGLSSPIIFAMGVIAAVQLRIAPLTLLALGPAACLTLACASAGGSAPATTLAPARGPPRAAGGPAAPPGPPRPPPPRG